MPIYEFYSPDTNKIYSFFARSLSAASLIPRCPDDSKARMERLISKFAVTGRAQEKSESPESDFDPRMERAMGELEREMSSLSEENPDPRQLGRMMRKMTEVTGQKIPETMEQMIRRLEKGEDPEKLEEDFGGAIDDFEGAFDNKSENEGRKISPVRTRRKTPERDPQLYEMRDYTG